jgi:hypothetical protein
MLYRNILHLALPPPRMTAAGAPRLATALDNQCRHPSPLPSRREDLGRRIGVDLAPPPPLLWGGLRATAFEDDRRRCRTARHRPGATGRHMAKAPLTGAGVSPAGEPHMDPIAFFFLFRTRLLFYFMFST